MLSAVGTAAGRAMRSAGAATFQAGRRMVSGARTFFSGRRSNMPRAARTVPLAAFDAARQDGASEGVAPAARLGISAAGHDTSEDG